MLIDSLAFAIEESGALAPVYEKLDAGQDATLAIAASARPFAIAARFAAHPQSMLAVIPGEDAVDGFARSIAAYVGDAHVAVFPMRCDYPFAPKEPDARFVARRAHAAWALQSGEDVIVVASAASACARSSAVRIEGLRADRCGRRGGKWSMPLRVRCSISNRWPMRS